MRHKLNILVSHTTHEKLKALEHGDKQVIFEAVADWIAKILCDNKQGLTRLASVLRVSKNLQITISLGDLIEVEREHEPTKIT